MARQRIAPIGAAFAATLLSLATANADSASDSVSWSSWADVFTKNVRDQTAISGETEWPDASALGYARSARADAAAVRWLPQPRPAVDGINAKIDGYGGGGNRTNGFYGATGSLSLPLAQQWGLQLDGGVASGNGSATEGGAGHLFWRDPSIALLGAYASYSRWNGIDTALFGHVSTSTSFFAAEGEYYWGRWTLRGFAGAEMLTVNTPDVLGSPDVSATRFSDELTASYYVTDNFKLSLGHAYTFGTNFLALGGEYGVALGGGRMAALFAEGAAGEHGDFLARAGLRIYFGQHDKSLIDRHRQDDPSAAYFHGASGFSGGYAGSAGYDGQLQAQVLGGLPGLSYTLQGLPTSVERICNNGHCWYKIVR